MLLAGTRQAEARARQDAELRRAGASSAPEGDRERLGTEAEQAAALAQTLEARARALAEVDEARARWLAHTAGTRAAAERAKAELAARHADDTEVEPAVTAEEWLAAHREALADDEQHREVTEIDVVDEQDAAAPEESEGELQPVGAADDERDTDVSIDEQSTAVEPEPDIREVAVAESAPMDEDDVRVPSADETADAVSRANQALVEIRVRGEADAQEEAAHRADQLAQRQDADEDTGAEGETAEGAELDDVDA